MKRRALSSCICFLLTEMTTAVWAQNYNPPTFSGPSEMCCSPACRRCPSSSARLSSSGPARPPSAASPGRCWDWRHVRYLGARDSFRDQTIDGKLSSVTWFGPVDADGATATGRRRLAARQQQPT